MPEGDYLELDIPSSILYEVSVSVILYDHAVSIIEFDSSESPFMKFLFFEEMIEVSVYVSAADFANNKRAFCHRFNYVGVSVPYDSIIDSFRCLFGSKSIVTFTVML